jgi:putative aldouronate transport system substrate-binding protein
MSNSGKLSRRNFLKTTGALTAGLTVSKFNLPFTAAAQKADKVVIWSPGDSGSVSDWATDPIVKAIEAATNTSITVLKIPRDGFVDRVNAAAASGELPDIIGSIVHTNFNLITGWVRDGVVVPFEGDVAKAAPNVLAEYERNPTLNELKVNGKIYAQPVGWGDGNFPNMGLVHVRKDLLDKYNMKPPDSFTEYFAYLDAAIKDGHSGVVFNGASSETGFARNVNPFAGAYGLPTVGWVKLEKGYGYWAVQPKMKDALLLMRDMIARKLIDEDSWGMKDEARNAFVSGKPASLIFNGGGHIGRIQNDMDLVGKGAKEWMLPAPTAGQSTRGYTAEPQFWSVTFLGGLRNNNPVAAARVINFLISDEGYKLTAVGVKGVDYEEKNGEILVLPARSQSRGFPKVAGGTGAHPIATAIVSWVPQSWQDWQLLYGKDQAYKDWYKQMWANQGKYQIPMYGSLSTTPLWTEFQPTSDELTNRAFLDIIKADSADKGASLFDKFVKDWAGAGGDKATAEMSALLSTLYK